MEAVIVTLVLGVLSLAVYLIPSALAIGRRHRQAGPIVVLNLLAGWTVLGWIGALVWSLTTDTRAPVYGGYKRRCRGCGSTIYTTEENPLCGPCKRRGLARTALPLLAFAFAVAVAGCGGSEGGAVTGPAADPLVGVWQAMAARIEGAVTLALNLAGDDWEETFRSDGGWTERINSPDLCDAPPCERSGSWTATDSLVTLRSGDGETMTAVYAVRGDSLSLLLQDASASLEATFVRAN